MNGPEHHSEAEQALKASTYQRQLWGEGRMAGPNDLYKASMWEMHRAQVHATLALAKVTQEVLTEVRDLAVARETKKAV